MSPRLIEPPKQLFLLLNVKFKISRDIFVTIAFGFKHKELVYADSSGVFSMF